MDIEQYIGHKIPVARITPELLSTLTPPPRGELRERAREHEQARHGGRGRRDERGPRRDHRGERREARPPAERPQPKPVVAETHPDEPLAARAEEAQEPAPAREQPAASRTTKTGRPAPSLRRRKPEIPAIG
jgi:ATP-dependent RNA helicase RhlB